MSSFIQVSNSKIFSTLFQHTLRKISNWSPYFFYASFESDIRLYKMHPSINQPRFCQDCRSFQIKMTDTSTTDDTREKVASF